MCPVIVCNLGNIKRLYLLVAGRRHFQRGRQIRPQLESVHATSMIALRHLLMDDSAACGHPLYVSRGNSAVISHAVSVLDSSSKHVGDGFNPAVGMPREPGKIILWNIIAE